MQRIATVLHGRILAGVATVMPGLARVQHGGVPVTGLARFHVAGLQRRGLQRGQQQEQGCQVLDHNTKIV